MTPKTIDTYLAAIPNPAQKSALRKLRQTIHKIIPQAQETISYGLPAFRLNGIPFAAFAAAKTHCSFYPMSGQTIAIHKADLKNYQTTKGSIHFQPDKPLPAALLRKLIKTRLTENTPRGR